MAVTAALVKELRERSGAGMMECKKALVETNGDIETAIEHMRKTGLTKADKKASRTTADGLVLLQADDDAAVIVEVNCETDFVAKGDDFQGFCNEVARLVLNEEPFDADALAGLKMESGATVDERRRELIAKIGENMAVRRFDILSADGGAVGVYSHGGRIGSAVRVEGGNADLARDIAMHVAASAPQYLNADAVPGDFLEKERELLTAQAADSGKPAEIVAKMVEGRLRKQLAEITLMGQPFVKDPDVTIEGLCKQHNATVTSFLRYQVGEGIEKEESDFAAEVMAQVNG